MRRSDYILLLITALCWGSSFMFIKIAIGELAPIVVTMGRMIIGATMLLAVAYFQRARRTGASPRLARHMVQSARERPWSLLFFGLLTATPLTLVAVGEQSVDSGMAGVVNASVPLWATLLALKWDAQHRSTPKRLIGVGIGFSGVVALALSRGAIGDGSTEVLGIATIAAASGMYASGAMIVRERLNHLPSIEVASWSVLIGSVLFAVPAAFALPTSMPSSGVLASVAALGVIGTFGGFMAYYELISRVGAARASMVTYLLPAFALIYGRIFLNEQLPIDALAAMTIILFGVWIGSRSTLEKQPAQAGAIAARELD